MNNANGLAAGQCGLSDGSTAGQWRLPNVKELQSLINFGFFNPALSNAAGTGHWTEGDAFSGLPTSFLMTYWWSSSSDVHYPDYAWNVFLGNGVVYPVLKTNTNYVHYVWPVRGGQ